ncbi:MAG: methyltransferase, partial [Alishewanella sp. 32-51-5]
MLTQLSRVLSRPTLLLSSLLLSSAVVASTPIASLEQAVNNNPLRSAANVARDQYRNPLPTLQFFDVTPQATVVEISPGGGWYTEILAPLLAEQGVYYAAHFPASAEGYGQRSRQAFIEKL